MKDSLLIFIVMLSAVKVGNFFSLTKFIATTHHPSTHLLSQEVELFHVFLNSKTKL